MSKMKEHYYDVLTAKSADEETFDEMANNLEGIEDEKEFWTEMSKLEDFYYNKVAA